MCKRIALLTPEFMTESQGGGGVGNYVLKMARALRDSGADPEVFVPSRSPGSVLVEGIRVERVARERTLLSRATERGLRPLFGPRSDLILHIADARRLARALERRHHELPFDIVQSSNHKLTGMFVARQAGRTHVVRISTSRRLYDDAYAIRHGMMSVISERLDVRIMKRADAAYAPSRFLADYFNGKYDTTFGVIRPPTDVDEMTAGQPPEGLPERYLVHFGSLGVRKGSDAVAQALSRAWVTDPSLKMVWAGRLSDEARVEYQRMWGHYSSNVHILGALDKLQLYGVVVGALASVLPSIVDNLPNTVIESLTLGIPVIGSDGASIDELVEHGRSGALVPIGDIGKLAETMLEAWSGRAPWLGAAFVAPENFRFMAPAVAVRAFLEFVESRAHG